MSTYPVAYSVVHAALASNDAGADTPGKCEQEQEQEAPRDTPGPSTPVDWSRQMRALQSLTATVRMSARGVRKEIRAEIPQSIRQLS